MSQGSAIYPFFHLVNHLQKVLPILILQHGLGDFAHAFLGDPAIAVESTEGVNEYHGEEHEDGEDEEGNLAPFFQFATEDNGVETALLEACSTVLVVMMVFGH